MDDIPEPDIEDASLDGLPAVEELGRAVLVSGTWMTILHHFRSQESESTSVALHRYQKIHGGYRLRSRILLKDEDSIMRMRDALLRWFPRKT